MSSDVLFYAGKIFLAYLMNRCTPGAVRLIFDQLEKRIGAYEFNRLFGTILTDRGVEFGKPQALETGIDGIERTSIYFCDPMRSGQKRRRRERAYHAQDGPSQGHQFWLPDTMGRSYDCEPHQLYAAGEP